MPGPAADAPRTATVNPEGKRTGAPKPLDMPVRRAALPAAGWLGNPMARCIDDGRGGAVRTRRPSVRARPSHQATEGPGVVAA